MKRIVTRVIEIEGSAEEVEKNLSLALVPYAGDEVSPNSSIIVRCVSREDRDEE